MDLVVDFCALRMNFVTIRYFENDQENERERENRHANNNGRNINFLLIPVAWKWRCRWNNLIDSLNEWMWVWFPFVSTVKTHTTWSNGEKEREQEKVRREEKPAQTNDSPHFLSWKFFQLPSINVFTKWLSFSSHLIIHE